MIVHLTHPIVVAGLKISEINVRPIGRNVFNSMKAVVTGNPDRPTVCRFAGRVSGRSPSTIDRLTGEDFDAVKVALLSEYRAAGRRLGSRNIKQT